VSEASGGIREINAVTLVVANMRVAVAFYRALGFESRFGGPDAAFTTLRAGTGFLNLQLGQTPPPIAGSWGRVIFFVDDVDAFYARAVAAGYEPLTEPADASWGERYFHIRDPDGHELSFARPLPPA
jgi:catechol 2,3-dioxygenase-like lactoylglutathione lyase family enzyme